MSDISEGDNGTTSFPRCNTCKHRLTATSCVAFEEIPDEILSGDDPHLDLWEGQVKDVIYETTEK